MGQGREAPTRIAAAALQRQVVLLLKTWGMETEAADVTAEVLLAADLRGIDSHGVAMLPVYDEQRRAGLLKMRPEVRRLNETPVLALLDADAGLGHYPSVLAMRLAIEKCAAFGLAAAAVRNSAHFGAAGVYALMAAEAGFIGLATSNVWRPSVVPTFAAEPLFGTNPLAFAAPAGRNPPFCLDMATSTVAIGKLRLAAFAGKPLPVGWAVDATGRPVTDPEEALRLRHLTPLGGTRELGSHKGYGLAVMVEILSALLPGASFAPLKPTERGLDTGHFFLVIDPRAFRGEGFEGALDALLDRLRSARPADPRQPVLVAGDPEAAAVEERKRRGIPLPQTVKDILRDLVRESGAAWEL